MRVIHKKSGTVLGENVQAANSFWTRLRGFMFVNSPKNGDGIFIAYSNAVHNCFVQFPIDVIFINQDNCIVKIIRGFKPWRFTRPYFTARHVIELTAGKVPLFVEEGDLLLIENPVQT